MKQKKNADTFADVIEIFSKIIVDCGGCRLCLS